MNKCILASLLAMSCLTAQAGVIDFDGHDNTIFGDEDTSNGVASLTLDGFVFSNDADHFHLINEATSGGVSNGTSVLYSDRAGLLTVTKTGGGTFDVASVLGFSTYLADTMSITGYFAAGGAISADFAINTLDFTAMTLTGFAGLDRLTFSANPQQANEPWGFGIENLVVTGADAGVPVPVPEPLTAGLFGIALAGLALSRRKSPR